MSSPTPVVLRRDLYRSPVDDRELWRESGQWIPTVGETYYCIFNPMTHEDQTPRNSPATDQGWGRSNTGFPDNFHQNVMPGQIQNPGVARQKWSKKSWIITACAAGLAVVIALSVGLTMLFTGKDDEDDDPLLNPDNWTDSAAMSRGIVAAGADCDQLEDYSGKYFGTCQNDGSQSNYLLGFGGLAAESVQKTAIEEEPEDSSVSLIQEDSWSIVCLAPHSGYNTAPDCQRLADAFGATTPVLVGEEITENDQSQDYGTGDFL